MPRSILGRTREYASEIPEYGVLTGQLRLRTLSLFLRAKSERRCRGIGLFSMPRSVLGRTREYASEIPEYGVLTGLLRLRTLSLFFGANKREDVEE